jgi:hypothetical protein
MRWTHGILAIAVWVLSSLAFEATMVAAEEPAGNDLRDIRIGMAVTDLPAAGYANFACANDQGHAIAAWSDWSNCPADKEGLHAVRFDYDPATSHDGTMVAGHPAILTLLVDDKGLVAGLRIVTDPKARLYIRKKAFLLGMQVKSRYGAEGWTCRQAQPADGEQPVGGVYIRESCVKTLQGRSITVERELFRRPDQDMKTFVDETRILIRRADAR